MDDPISVDSLLAKGPGADPVTGAMGPPIQPATTFIRDDSYELVGEHIYARYGSPTNDAVEGLIAELEGAPDAALFGAGLAAVASVFETVRAGAHIAVPLVMYHGAQDWIRRIAERRDIGLTLFEDVSPASIEAALEPGRTDLVWLECPVNPTWDVADLTAVSDVAHAAGALLAVDGTGAPPVTTRALDFGADYVFHSGTKYYNGHSDVLAGILAPRVKDERWDEIREIRKMTGGVLGPFGAWLLQRGMRTMHLRYQRASSNALELARHLETHSGVERVLYPGLESHPDHEVASRQMTGGFGGMLSVLTAGGEKAAAATVRAVEIFEPATSLGGVESVIEHRSVVEGPHSVVPPNLLRISVGIESVDDLVTDLDQALPA